MTADRVDTAAGPGEVAAAGDDAVPAHEGPWTEDAYLGPASAPLRRGAARVELVDGALLVGPGPTEERTQAVERVREAITEALPDGLRVLGPVAVRLGPDCVLVPDLVVARAVEGGPEVLDAADVLMVVEVVGGEHGAVDRLFKPQLYARGRIPYSVIVDRDSPFAAASMIIGGRYHEYARVSADDALLLEEPFRVRIPLAQDGVT